MSSRITQTCNLCPPCTMLMLTGDAVSISQSVCFTSTTALLKLGIGGLQYTFPGNYFFDSYQFIIISKLCESQNYPMY
jgi:hypothetical protein